MNKSGISKLKKEHVLYPLSALLLLLSCFFMYDFYKCLSGFIANGFRYPTMMLPLILTYLIPPVMFLFFFYDTFVKRPAKIAEIIYSVLVVGLSVFCLVGIISNFSVYYSNNQLGVYDALPGIIIKFPFDGIVICALAISAQAIRLISCLMPNSKLALKKEWVCNRGRFCLGVVEYLILSVFSIVAFLITFLISSIEISSTPKYFSISSSSCSTTVSTRFVRYLLASSIISSGIASSLTSLPRSS